MSAEFAAADRDCASALAPRRFASRKRAGWRIADSRFQTPRENGQKSKRAEREARRFSPLARNLRSQIGDFRFNTPKSKRGVRCASEQTRSSRAAKARGSGGGVRTCLGGDERLADLWVQSSYECNNTCSKRKSSTFFRNAKIERVQGNRSEHARRCAVLSSNREGLFAVSEAAVAGRPTPMETHN